MKISPQSVKTEWLESTYWNEILESSSMNSHLSTYHAKDQSHICFCTELPSLSWLDKSLTQTLYGIMTMVTENIINIQATHEFIPSILVTTLEAV